MIRSSAIESGQVFKCQGCEEDFETTNNTVGYWLNHQGLEDKYQVFVTSCPHCGARNEIQPAIKHNRPGRRVAPPKATKRILGTDIRLPDRTRWYNLPADLMEALEEEKRIREKMKKDGEDIEDQEGDVHGEDS